jgi:hypothetical protein
MDKEKLEKATRTEQDGWIYLHLEGSALDRGYQHGVLAASEIADVLKSLKFLTYWNTGMTWDYFVEKSVDLYAQHFTDLYLDEIKGIAQGAQDAGVEVSWQEILAWNGYCEITSYWWPTQQDSVYADMKEKCSAFIATGSLTIDGRVVMAHNSWDNFETGQFSNFILDIVPLPEEGNRIFMQAAPGYIHSGTDFFATGAGIMGTETTIGGFNKYNPDGVPEFLRVRRAMQEAKSLDDFVSIMLNGNNGGYANSWLLADSNSLEILRLELGLKFYNIERKTDGYFIGFNAAYDPRIRNLECSNTGFGDIRRHQGARQVRLEQLMQNHKGKISVDIGQTILADHYDVYLNKENPCSRTVDGHYELDAREYMCQPGRPIPFQPRGTYDGKVMDSEMAKKLSFNARWGNSSGMPFETEPFFLQHPQWDYLKGYLKDRPSQPWSCFGAKYSEI